MRSEELGCSCCSVSGSGRGDKTAEKVETTMGHGDDLRGGGAPGASVSEKTGKPGRADELDVWRVHSWWGNSFHFKAFF